MLTLSGAARNSLRRCSSVKRDASGARLSVQSSALSAVYGGAFHPSAEGHAAMADAALPAAREVLGLKAPPKVIAEPLPPPPTVAPAQ